jgi:hypothetical protein
MTKRSRPAIDVLEDNDEPETSRPPNVIQRHTHLESTHSGIKSSKTYYSMPASPQKKSMDAEQDQIHWNIDSDDPLPDLIDDDDDDDDDEQQSRLMDPDHRDIRPKRSRYDPLNAWVPEIDSFTEEFLRLEGRGDAANQTACARCASLVPPSLRCDDCEDIRLFCSECIVASHGTLPFHRVKVSISH